MLEDNSNFVQKWDNFLAKAKVFWSVSRISRKQWKFTVAGAVFLLSSFFSSVSSFAQCSMCRAAIESEGDNIKAEAVNDGIVYLMIIPYLLVAGIMYYVYATRIRKKPETK